LLLRLTLGFGNRENIMNVAMLSMICIVLGAQAYAGELTVRSTTGANLVEVVRSPAEKAKIFLKQVAAELNLQADLSDLELESVIESAAGYHVRFQQMKGGLPVHNADVVVTVSKNNQVLSYQSSYRLTDSSKRAPEFSISAETARNLVYEHLALTASPEKETIEQKIMVIDGVSRPVYQIKISAPVDKKWGWLAVVDADSGAIRESRSLVHDDRTENGQAFAAPTPHRPGTPIHHTPVPVHHTPAPVHHNPVPVHHSPVPVHHTPAPVPVPVQNTTVQTATPSPVATPMPVSTPASSRPNDPNTVSISANVFDPNPTIKSNMAYGGSSGFTDNNNADSPFFDSMMKQTTVQGSLVNGKYVLTGKYVTITDQETPRNPDCTSTTAAMNFKRSDLCFDDVNAFYHITQSLTYLNETLGIKAGPILYQGPFHADPHGLDGDDNSHYSDMTDEIAYGEGGVDDAQDHDVLLHELGHAIHNWVTHGHISQVEGLSEGIGDYWASSYSRSQMDSSNVAWNWTFSYDGHNEFWDGRVVNTAGTYPAAAQGEIHDAGQLWASSCMDIWVVIGKYKMDKIFWSGISMLGSNSSQLDAAKAVYAAAKQLFPADAPIVKAKFNARGYAVQ
jgi:hypothetical protein